MMAEPNQGTHISGSPTSSGGRKSPDFHTANAAVARTHFTLRSNAGQQADLPNASIFSKLKILLFCRKTIDDFLEPPDQESADPGIPSFPHAVTNRFVTASS